MRTLLGVAHGTRSAVGQAQLRELMDQVACRRPDLDVRLAYVDVQQPRVAEALRPGAVLVPLLLSTGYHVRVDIADAVAGTDARVTAPLGPDPALTEVLAARLPAATDAVVLAAAGSSEARWQAEVGAVAASLNAHVAYASGGGPRVPDVVAGLRRAGAAHVTVATYLLADGLFYRSLHHAGADVVTPPLITSPVIADLVLSRYLKAGRDLTTADVTLTEEMNGCVTAGGRAGNRGP